MADKVQNITINYKFNTADIDKANQSLNQANQASNKLQASGQKAGSAISQEFQKSNKTILDMQNALTRLKSTIEVTSNPAKLKQLSAEYKSIKTQMDAATAAAFKLEGAIKSQGAATGGLSSTFGKLGTAVTAFASIAVLKQIANITLELARLAGNSEGVERAFNRAFPNATQILNNLRTATKGTIGDFELMQRTLQATNLGVSVQQLPRLFEFAAARAQQTGESVDYLVDSIVRGIGRKSPLILDNLGISAIRLKEKFGGAALAAQSVGDVTKAVGEIAEEELGKMGGFAETSATKVDQLSVAFEKLRLEFSKKIESGGLIDFVKDYINLLSDALKGNTQRFIEESKTMGVKDAEAIIERLKDFKGSELEKTEFLQQEINSRVQITGRYNDKVSELSAELLKIKAKETKAFDEFGNVVPTSNENPRVKRLEAEITALKGAVISINETRITLKALLDDMTKEEEKQILTIKVLKDQLKELQTQREEATFVGDTRELDRLQREILLLDDRILKIADNIKWQKQWDRSKEESALSAINAAQAEKELEEAIEAVNNAIGITIGKAPSFDESMKEFEQSVTEVAESIKLTTGQEFLIRLRLGFQGKGGEASEIQDWINKELKKIGLASFDLVADQAHSMVDVELETYKQRLSNLQEFYDGQILLAGDNERAKDQIRIKEARETKKLREDIARKEKQAARTHVVIDIATGIAKALATYQWPYSLIPAAFVAAQGVAQLAIINRQPTNFAKGSPIGIKGPGTETSDSIPANLSKGETVMNAWETRVAGDVLRDIRAKKLDNEKLREMKQGRTAILSPAIDSSGIIKAIKEQKHPDIVKASNIVYESKKYTEDYKKRVRSSSMGI